MLDPYKIIKTFILRTVHWQVLCGTQNGSIVALFLRKAHFGTFIFLKSEA